MNKENIDIENIYIIGGSPCSGKSTIAEMLRDKHGFHYLKIDDFLYPFMEELAASGNELLQKVNSLSTDAMWLRTPEILNEEEIKIYRDMFPLVLKELNSIKSKKPIVAEGAAFMPELVKELGVPKDKYICIVPSKEFQMKEYSKRTQLIEYILADASAPEKAFDNWMKRDMLFAEEVFQTASKLDYHTILTDGSKTIEENFNYVEQIFSLK